MVKKQNPYFWLKNLTLAFAVLSLFSCASVQSPTGGPRDSISPKVISENPKNLTRNFSSQTISIEFDELIKLNNETNEISITPELERFPNLKIKKQVLDISFQDTLEKNTTYTINFGKAVGDVNENNLLKNYTYVFSTGNMIDSLSISGTVKSMEAKEKNDIMVFIIPVSRDSIFGKKKASIFTTTDSSGNFKLQNLKEDTYRIYALKEPSQGDRIFNSASEEIGFLTDSIVLNKNISGIALQTFKEIPQKLGIKDKKIEADGRISILLNKPAIAPSLRILNPPAADASKTVEFTATRDTAMLWVPDMTFDSLEVSVTDQNIAIDTIILRRSKRDSYTRAITFSNNLAESKLRPRTDLIITASTPLVSVDPSKLTLLEDSVRTTGIQTTRVEGNTRQLRIRHPWRAKRSYILNMAEGSVTDIYGTKSKPATVGLVLDDAENYANVTLKFKLPDSTAYLVEMLKDEKTVTTAKIPQSGRVDFLNYPTGKYRFKVIYDKNDNGKWDTGNVRERRQPEPTWEYQKDITLRPNWDIEELITVPKTE